MFQTVLITGASSGIGLELAKYFAKKKHHLVLVARRKQELETIATELRKKHQVMIFVLPQDLSNPKSPTEIIEKLKISQIHIDILVNNAGFGNAGSFVDTPLDQELAMIEVNITTLTHLTKLLLPAMIKKGYGRILNLASTAGFQPVPLLCAYSASKAYVLHFTEALGNELRGTGVTATALCPGPTPTNFAVRSKLGQLSSRQVPSAANVAKAGYHALMQGKPVVIVGWKNKLLTFLIRLIPRVWVVKIIRILMEQKISR